MHAADSLMYAPSKQQNRPVHAPGLGTPQHHAADRTGVPNAISQHLPDNVCMPHVVRNAGLGEHCGDDACSVFLQWSRANCTHLVDTVNCAISMTQHRRSNDISILSRAANTLSTVQAKQKLHLGEKEGFKPTRNARNPATLVRCSCLAAAPLL